jgi:osmotically-inducible protein OsmY
MVHSSSLLTNDALSKCPVIGLPSASALLVNRAKALLHGSSHRALRSVSCVYYAGVLRLQGSVPTYYLKQVAQSLLLSMEEAPRVQNELVVGQPSKPR